MAKITADQYRPANETSFGSGAPDLTSNVSPIFTMIGSQTMDDVLKLLRSNGEDVTSSILWDLIHEYKPRRDVMESLYQRYVGDERGVPIKTRTLKNPNKVNNKLANDFFGDIVDTKVGYFGTGISVELGKDGYTDQEFNEDAWEADNQVIADYRTDTDAQDVETDLSRQAAVCGYGVKLLYVLAGETQVRQQSVFPWECIFIYDRTVAEPQYAMRSYKVKVQEGTEKRERWRVEWYDKQNITFYIEDGDKHFVLDETEPQNPKQHYFSDVPLICFPNNRQLQGDCEKVLDLIDAYDRTMSDVNSEVEQLRLAYMYIKGAGLNIDANLVEQMKQTGVFPLGENGDVGFITKTLDDSVIENHLNRITQNIMRFAKSVDFGDASFGGQMPVIAYQIKVAGLEQKSKIAEMKFRTALRYEYRLLTEAWRTWRQADIDVKDIQFTFTRSLPPNLEGEINMLRNGTGLVSQKTLFGLMSFIDDPEEEIRRMEEEKGDSVDLDAVPQEMMDGDEEPGDERAGVDRSGDQAGTGSDGAAAAEELQGRPG